MLWLDVWMPPTAESVEQLGVVMQAKLITYEHSANGVALFVTPETAAERALLRGIWQHGEMKTCNGIADNSGQGFCVHWYFKDDKNER